MHWNRLLREVVKSLSLGVFKKHRQGKTQDEAGKQGIWESGEKDVRGWPGDTQGNMKQKNKKRDDRIKQDIDDTNMNTPSDLDGINQKMCAALLQKMHAATENISTN
ncbi:hypothetical protein WISP_63351 [Willisornis vidua]|uniref:Uncharacterized protein n=1 Tax=Willisornis vidua TaxID=1566151 RepID=A0ABQ9DEZ0_9PASS|nr:hypothetical protein WISP_63351 [Willisornis vidua]